MGLVNVLTHVLPGLVEYLVFHRPRRLRLLQRDLFFRNLLVLVEALPASEQNTTAPWVVLHRAASSQVRVRSTTI